MNIVRVVTPPALIEQGRSMQYANREALNARMLSRSINIESIRRKSFFDRRNPNNQNKAGGKLEFMPEKTPKLWRRRRISNAGYFLLPQGPASLVNWSDRLHFPAEANVYDRVFAPSGDWVYRTDILGLTYNLTGFEFNAITQSNKVLTPSARNVNQMQFDPAWPGADAVSGTHYEGGLTTGIFATDKENDIESTFEFFGYFPPGGFTNALEQVFTDLNNGQGPQFYTVYKEYGYATFVFECSSGYEYFQFVATKNITNSFGGDAFLYRRGSNGGFSDGLSGLWYYDITYVPNVIVGPVWNFGASAGIPLGTVSSVIPHLPQKDKIHFALTEKNKVLRFYIDGTLINSYNLERSGFLENDFRFATTSGKVAESTSLGPPSFVTRVYSGLPQGRVNLSEIRFTSGQVLYSGNTFNPPTSITGLL